MTTSAERIDGAVQGLQGAFQDLLGELRRSLGQQVHFREVRLSEDGVDIVLRYPAVGCGRREASGEPPDLGVVVPEAAVALPMERVYRFGVDRLQSAVWALPEVFGYASEVGSPPVCGSFADYVRGEDSRLEISGSASGLVGVGSSVLDEGAFVSVLAASLVGDVWKQAKQEGRESDAAFLETSLEEARRIFERKLDLMGCESRYPGLFAAAVRSGVPVKLSPFSSVLGE